MVYRHGINLDFTAVAYLNSFCFFKHFHKKFLRAENLVTATESFDFRENAVERFNTERHRICIVYNPRLGAVFFDIFRNVFIHRNCAHCSYNSSGTGCVADGLIYAVFFGCVNVRLHFVKRCGKN